MTESEWSEIKEVELLRKALTEAEALCLTLDHCEFVEPIDYDCDIDAKRAKVGIEKRLKLRESQLLRKVKHQSGRLPRTVVA